MNIKTPETGGYLLQSWNIICNHKNGSGKVQNFTKSTKSGATNLPPVGGSFMHIETSSNNHGAYVFCSFAPADVIQISKKTFYHTRYLNLTNDPLNSVGRFRIQLLLSDKTWSTRRNVPKRDRYSGSTTDWTLVSLKFTVEN